jgi:hypothetical protein
MTKDAQVTRLRQLLGEGHPPYLAALKVGMDAKTARKYRHADRLPSESFTPRIWRTREDPFQDVWPELRDRLERAPGLQAETLFEDLQRRFPGRFPDSQLRTLQRRIKAWRATEGPPKEVFFDQIHSPGELGASDFTCMNELQVDDGGSFDSPAHHILLEGLVVRDIGPEGNLDGIKLSGVDDFRVEGCTIERWSSGGSAIDMVGCHRGTITGCTFRHGDSAGDSGVQAKGGSAEILIRRCQFEQAGSRAINLGGSTGLAFIRPRPQGYEAKAITVEDCTFIGSQAPVAFVGADGAEVRHNTIYRPRRHALRILQETTGPGFVPCRHGRFTDNLIAFRSEEMTLPVNIGPGTAPETFVLARNAWYCLDAPDRSRPRLPIAEAEGVYGVDPRFRDGEAGDLRHRTDGPAGRVGARARDIGPEGGRP